MGNDGYRKPVFTLKQDTDFNNDMGEYYDLQFEVHVWLVDKHFFSFTNTHIYIYLYINSIFFSFDFSPLK